MKDAPDFVNARGEVKDAKSQVDALGQAQSIIYLSIFIMQCFNVGGLNTSGNGACTDRTQRYLPSRRNSRIRVSVMRSNDRISDLRSSW